MNILITSVGRRSYLVNYFKEALCGKGEVHVMNSSNISPAFKVADKASVSPLIYDSNYISFLLDYCQKYDIKIIISLFDVDVLMLAKNKKLFEKIGVKIIVSDENFVDICNDKWKTYEFLINNKFNTPKTFLKKELFFQSLKKGEINYPVIIKPRWGMGSLSTYEACNDNELEVLYNKIKNEIKNSYLKYEASQDIENAIIIQEKLNGEEYGLDIINDLNGNYKNTIIKKKYAMRSGETDCAKIIENEKIKDIGERLASISKHIANLDVDVFLHDDKVFVLEMNARFGGGYPFSHIAGVNLPKAILGWYNNEEVSNDLLYAEIGTVAHKDIDITKLEV